MDWSGAKNWLILLFAGLNIFLICTLVSVNSNAGTVKKDTILKTVEILSSNGISIDEAVINPKIPKLNSVEVENAIGDKKAFAKKLLGDGFTEDNDLYTKEEKSVRFFENSFSYKNSKPDDPISDLNSLTVKEKVSSFLSGLGISVVSAESVATENNGNFTVTFYQRLDKYSLFDSYITVNLSKDGISLIEGSWFYTAQDQSSVKTSASRVTPATSALIDFISDEKRISNNSTKVTDVTIGYTSGDSMEYHTHASAIPVWRIKTSDGHCYYFDAR